MAEGSPIQVAERPDGTVLYDLPFPATDLPPVFRRDLVRAWEASRDAAILARREGVALDSALGAPRSGRARLFRFAGAAVLSLSDRDARCWAAAVDRTAGLGTAYGVSLLLRLLSLVDLLAHSPGLGGGVAVRRHGAAEISPALLRAASACRMTGDARLDETCLRDALASTGVAA